MQDCADCNNDRCSRCSNEGRRHGRYYGRDTGEPLVVVSSEYKNSGPIYFWSSVVSEGALEAHR